MHERVKLMNNVKFNILFTRTTSELETKHRIAKSAQEYQTAIVDFLKQSGIFSLSVRQTEMFNLWYL